MTDPICKETNTPCQTPGMCSPHGGCRIVTLKCHLEVSQDTLAVIRHVLRMAEAEIDGLKAENAALRAEAKQSAEPIGCIVVKTWFEGAPCIPTLYGHTDRESLRDGDLLYLAPGPCSELAITVLEILRTAKDIPDGLYAKAKNLATRKDLVVIGGGR
jgi:hypothetical protein